MKNTTEESLIFFLHIPKTAGTTLISLMDKIYQSEQIHNLHSDGWDIGSLTKNFIVKIVKGHMYFGLHERISRPCKYITILRDPVDRVLSFYHFALSFEGHYAHQEVKSKTIVEYIKTNASTEICNDQTRRISGMQDVGFVKYHPEMMQKAKENLKNHFTFTGVTEKFDESIVLLNSLFGWDLKWYEKLNQTEGRPSQDQLSEETLEVINDYNQMDIELYHYACKLLDQSIDRMGVKFSSDLKKLQTYNNLFLKYRHFKLSLRNLFRLR